MNKLIKIIKKRKFLILLKIKEKRRKPFVY